MKKKILIIFLFIPVTQCVFPQNPAPDESEVKAIRGAKIKMLEIPNQSLLHRFINIAKLIVYDDRPDTSVIGFQPHGEYKPTFISLPGGVRDYLERYVNTIFSSGSQDSSLQVVLILKKCWLTDDLNIGEYNFMHPENNPDSKRLSLASGIMIRIEFYLKQQSVYFPLYRYDSTFTDFSSITEGGPQYLGEALLNSLSRLKDIDRNISNYTQKRKELSWNIIADHNQQQISFPILQDTVLQRGVYQTFDEFKKNSPSLKSFTLRNEKLNDIIYIQQDNGKEYVARNIWGYCDGTNVFVRSADNFFLLQRINHAYYVYGAKTLTRKTAPISGDGIGNSYPPLPGNTGLILSQIPTKHVKLKRKPFQLDWDTGQLD